MVINIIFIIIKYNLYFYYFYTAYKTNDNLFSVCVSLSWLQLGWCLSLLIFPVLKKSLSLYSLMCQENPINENLFLDTIYYFLFLHHNESTDSLLVQ